MNPLQQQKCFVRVSPIQINIHSIITKAIYASGQNENTLEQEREMLELVKDVSVKYHKWRVTVRDTIPILGGVHLFDYFIQNIYKQE